MRCAEKLLPTREPPPTAVTPVRHARVAEPSTRVASQRPSGEVLRARGDDDLPLLPFLLFWADLPGALTLLRSFYFLNQGKCIVPHDDDSRWKRKYQRPHASPTRLAEVKLLLQLGEGSRKGQGRTWHGIKTTLKVSILNIPVLGDLVTSAATGGHNSLFSHCKYHGVVSLP